MSNKLMDTEPGGESGQYEGNLGYVEPVKKQAGQLGDPSAGTQMADQIHKSASTAPNSQGVTPAEKLRYGQTIQESGGGGGKTSAEGHASSEGFGRTERIQESMDEGAQRRAQGYIGGNEMDPKLGG